MPAPLDPAKLRRRRGEAQLLLKRPPAIQVQGDLIARIAVGSWAGHWWMPEPMRLARRSSAREGPVTALKSTERFPDSVLRPNPIDRPNSAHGGPILGLPAKYGRSEEAPGNIRGLDFRAATVGLWAAIVRPSRGHLDSHLRKGMPDFGSTAVSSSTAHKRSVLLANDLNTLFGCR